MKHGKKYGEAAKLVDRATQYDPAEAISLVKKTATAKFDETVEVHIRTGCDGRHAEQQNESGGCDFYFFEHFCSFLSIIVVLSSKKTTLIDMDMIQQY